MLKLFLIVFLFSTSIFAEEKLRIITSFSVLKSMVEEFSNEKFTVESIVGNNQDAHIYSPSANDIAKISKANFVFVNGLGFDESIIRLAKSARVPLVYVSFGVRPLKSELDEVDPHAWHDPRNGIIYYTNIYQALAKLIPSDEKYFNLKFVNQKDRLEKVYNENLQFLNSNNLKNLKVLTSHDAFSYFGKAYNVTFIAPHSVSTEAEPSALMIAKIIEQIKTKKIKKVFLENMSDPRNIEMITKDTNIKITGTLCADALTNENGNCGTYMKMLEHNFSLIVRR